MNTLTLNENGKERGKAFLEGTEGLQDKLEQKQEFPIVFRNKCKNIIIYDKDHIDLDDLGEQDGNGFYGKENIDLLIQAIDKLKEMRK